MYIYIYTWYMFIQSIYILYIYIYITFNAWYLERQVGPLRTAPGQLHRQRHLARRSGAAGARTRPGRLGDLRPRGLVEVMGNGWCNGQGHTQYIYIYLHLYQWLFRILNWNISICIYIYIYIYVYIWKDKSYVSGSILSKYGQQYGTNVPPF